MSRGKPVCFDRAERVGRRSAMAFYAGMLLVAFIALPALWKAS
jgi:hypothetical protein